MTDLSYLGGELRSSDLGDQPRRRACAEQALRDASQRGQAPAQSDRRGPRGGSGPLAGRAAEHHRPAQQRIVAHHESPVSARRADRVGWAILLPRAANSGCSRSPGATQKPTMSSTACNSGPGTGRSRYTLSPSSTTQSCCSWSAACPVSCCRPSPKLDKTRCSLGCCDGCGSSHRAYRGFARCTTCSTGARLDEGHGLP